MLSAARRFTRRAIRLLFSKYLFALRFYVFLMRVWYFAVYAIGRLPQKVQRRCRAEIEQRAYWLSGELHRLIVFSRLLVDYQVPAGARRRRKSAHVACGAKDGRPPIIRLLGDCPTIRPVRQAAVVGTVGATVLHPYFDAVAMFHLRCPDND